MGDGSLEVYCAFLLVLLPPLSALCQREQDGKGRKREYAIYNCTATAGYICQRQLTINCRTVLELLAAPSRSCKKVLPTWVLVTKGKVDKPEGEEGGRK